MIFGRTMVLSLALIAAAGCGSAGTAPPAMPPAPPLQSAPSIPAESSAARYILANAGASAPRGPQRWDGEGDEDDGGRGQLQLPVLHACAGGTYATDCAAWAYTANPNGGTRGAARATQTINYGTPPSLNFCPSDFPAELGAPATPVYLTGTYQFPLSYVGTHAPPIVAFATRWWNVNFQPRFFGTAKTADPVLLTPVLSNGAARGWLVFFTWSWPADVLLVPYAINEIQIARASSPLAIAPHGSAALGAFDCLGRPVTATRRGAGFGFSANLAAGSFTSASSVLTTPVFGGTSPAGSIVLTDDRGARSVDQVVTAP